MRGYFGDAADVDDGKQHAQFGRRQIVHLADHLVRRGRLQSRLANEQGRDGVVGQSREDGVRPMSSEHMSDVALATAGGQRQRHAFDAEGGVARGCGGRTSRKRC